MKAQYKVVDSPRRRWVMRELKKRDKTKRALRCCKTGSRNESGQKDGDKMDDNEYWVDEVKPDVAQVTRTSPRLRQRAFIERWMSK